MIKLSRTMRSGNVSLWINGSNVWDIPPEHATQAVLCAIEHAYELGRQSAMEEALSALERIETRIPFGETWQEAQ